MVEADRRVTLREFVLLTLLRQRLREGAGQPIRTQFRKIEEVAADAHARAVAGFAERTGQAAFEKGAAVLKLGWQAPLAREALTTAKVSESLERLRHLSPFAKPGILKACFEAAAADGVLRLAGGRAGAHGRGDARLPGAAAARRAGSRRRSRVKTFFEHQSLARRNTKVMVVLFALAVVAVIVAVDWCSPLSGMWSHRRLRRCRPASTSAGALGTAALILIVSLVQHRAPGAAAARRWRGMVGARRGARPTPPIRSSGACATWSRRWRSPSGVRVPEVYVMDERARHQRLRRRLGRVGRGGGGDARHARDADARRAAGRGRRTSSATS